MRLHYFRYTYIDYKVYGDSLYKKRSFKRYTKRRMSNMKTKYLAIIALVTIVIIIGGVFAYISMQNPSAGTSVTLNASGATFPQPFLSATITAYSSVKPNVQINYQAVGSGAGINALTAKTVDFAASDAPLSSNQTSQLSSPAVHIPETIGAVTLAYNLPGVSGGLKLTGDVVARIYLGTITNWNDAVHRSP